MSLTAGELNAYLRLDDSPFARGLDMAGAKFQQFKARLDAQLAEVDRSLKGLAGTIRVQADVRPAERDVRAMVRRLNALRVNITCNIPIERAQQQLDEIQQRIRAVSRMRANPSVRIESADTLVALRSIISLIERIDRAHPSVRVDAHTATAEAQLRRLDRAQSDAGRNNSLSRLSTMLGGIGAAASSAAGGMGSVAASAGLITAVLGAAIPVVAGLVAVLAQIAPAAAVGVTAALSLGAAFAAIKIGTGGLGSAFKAAFAPAVGGGGAAVNTARQVADAQRALKDATQQAAYANQQAAQETARAERQVADAQKAARQAQADLNAAREQATRDLQDMNESLKDAYIDQEQAILDVRTAQKQLDADQQAGAGDDTIRQDQINLERAKQRLEEQDIATKRLKEDTDKANKAGVDGSQTMIQARQKVADANQTVADQEQALADARTQQARTAAQGLENIQKASEALAAAGQKAGGGVAKLDNALAKLAPNARAFVQQVIALRGAWTALQQDVQNRLFAGLAASLRTTATAVLPGLRTGLVGTAGALNAMALGAAAAATRMARNGTLGQALAGANTGLRNLKNLPGQVVTALFQIGAAAAPAFDRLTAAAARGATSISGKLEAAFKSGRLEHAIDQAVALIKQIGVIASNVGHILGSIFSAANQSGAGFLNTLTVITGALAKAFDDPAVQAGLHALFQTMSLVARTAGPLLIQALQTIAPVITALAPPVQQVVRLLGGELGRIITALGPVLVTAAQAVGRLLVAMAPLLDVVPVLLPPLGTLISALAAGLVPVAVALQPVLMAAAGAIGQLAVAVAPLLPVIGQMIASLGPILTPILQIIGQAFVALAPVLAQLGRSLLPPLAKITTTLAGAFKQMAPVVGKALQQLGSQGLMPIVVGLAAVISQLVDQYADQWLNMFQMLLPVIPQLIPVVIQLGQSLGQILLAVAPLLPQITLLTAQLITRLLPAILPLLPVLARLEIVFLRLVTGAITGIVIPGIKALVAVAQGLQAALQPMIDAVKWVTQHVAGAFQWLYDVLLGHSIIPDIVNGAVGWFAGLPGRAWRALSGLAGNLAGRAQDALNSMIRAIITGLRAAVSWLSDLPGRAVDALGDLSSTLYKSGQHLLGGFIDGIKSMGDKVGSAVSNVLSSASDFFPHSPAKRGPFSGRGYPLYSGMAISQAVAAGITSRQGAVLAAARQLAAGAHDALAVPGTPMGALVTRRLSSGATGRRPVDGYGGTGSTRHVLVVQVKGNSNDLLVQSLRESISNRGGDVQFVLGAG